MKLTAKQIALSVILLFSGVLFSVEAINSFDDQNRTDGNTGGGIISSRSFAPSYTIRIVSSTNNIIIKTSSDNIDAVIDQLPSGRYEISYLDASGFIVFSMEYTK